MVSTKIDSRLRGTASGLTAGVRAFAERVACSAKLRSLKAARRSFPLRRYVMRRLGFKGKPYGINLVAYIRAEMGLGEAARGMAAAMAAAAVPFRVVNFEHGNPSRHTNTSWSHKEADGPDYDVTVLCLNPDNKDALRTRLPNALLGSRYVVGSWYWELPDFPEEWTSEFALVNEVWAATRFIQDAVSLKSPVPVVRIPPVVAAPSSGGLPRGYFGLPEGRFLFLTVCDTRSVLERKNPVGAVRAFKEAFRRSDPRVALAVKLNNPDYGQPELERLREEVAGCDNIHVLEGVYTRGEMDSLLGAADCVVSLHRAEGFGLVPAEAMSLGKPVILTNWSGNTDYMTPDNSFAVGYELVSLGRDYGIYKSHQVWAEPDVAEAARWMGRLLDEPGLAERVGRRARAEIEARFSPAAVGAIIRRRLDYIRRNN